MQTYYFQYKLLPTLKNKYYEMTEGASACCWVVAKDEFSALNIARFHVEKDEWCIKGMGFNSTVCHLKHFEGKDIGQKQFFNAQKDGISIVYIAWARDRKTYKEMARGQVRF